MTLTHAQQRVLVDVSDGDWHQLVPHHATSVVQQVYAFGLIRPDNDSARYADRIWTITQRGLDVLEGE